MGFVWPLTAGFGSEPKEVTTVGEGFDLAANGLGAGGGNTRGDFKLAPACGPLLEGAPPNRSLSFEEFPIPNVPVLLVALLFVGSTTFPSGMGRVDLLPPDTALKILDMAFAVLVIPF